MTDKATPCTEPDAMLRTLVDVVEGGCDEEELKVTLTVDGFLIFGKIVPEWLWLEETGLDLFPEKKARYERVKELRSREAEELTDEEKEEMRLSPRYIHLAEATVLACGRPVAQPDPPFMWRGNLQHVSGRCKGAMTMGPAVR